MNELNVVVISGRLTADAKKQTLPSGTDLLSLSIAVNRSWRNKDNEWQDDTSFIDVSLFGPGVASLDLVKADRVLVEGQLQQDRWEDSEGQKRSKVTVRARRVYPMFARKPAAAAQPAETHAVYPNEEIPF